MNRPLLALSLLALTLGCEAPQAAEPAAPAPLTDLRTRRDGDDWPQFLGQHGTSISDEKGVSKPWPSEGPPIVWKLRLGEGYTAPTTSLGRLFQFTRFGDEATLLCLHAETGKELWTFTYVTDYSDKYGYDGGPRCSPVIDGDRVYIYGPEGKLHCLRTVDGSLVWKVDTQAEFNVVQNFFGVGATPVVYGNLLITMVGGSPPGDEDKDFSDLTPNGTGVVAFDKLTGKVVYKSTDALASYASPVIVSQAGRDWGLLFARSGLVAFEPLTGKVDFEFPWRARTMESVNAANPVVSGDKVLISECYGPGSALLKYAGGKPEVVWEDDPRSRNKRLKSHWCTPVVVDGHIYGCHGRHSNEAELRCLNLETGDVTWSLPAPGEFEPMVTRSSLTYADGHFFCLGEYGQLRLFKANPKKYEEVSYTDLGPDGSRQLRYPCWAAPVISHGYMYLRGEKGLLCLDLRGQAAGPAAAPQPTIGPAPR